MLESKRTANGARSERRTAQGNRLFTLSGSRQCRDANVAQPPALGTARVSLEKAPHGFRCPPVLMSEQDLVWVLGVVPGNGIH